MLKKIILSFSILICLSSFSYAEQLIIEPDMGRAPILACIKNAKSSVQLVMYGFTDTQFMDALAQVNKSGKLVSVILEKYPYKSDSENAHAIQSLQQANIQLKWSNPDYKLTHQKTLILDNKTALIMTFNFTNSTFKNERNFALLIDDPAMVREIEAVYHADWDYKNTHVDNSHLVWSPNNSREKLLHFIQQAQSSIEMYAQDVADYKTIGALANAARKGVKIQIITSAKPTVKNNKKYDYLMRAGVTISHSKKYYIHAKVIIIDHRYAMLGSMNLSKASIDDNRELSVITQNRDVIDQLENTFKHDWAPDAVSSKHSDITTDIHKTFANIHRIIRHLNQL